jgi:hypothetical protein
MPTKATILAENDTLKTRLKALESQPASAESVDIGSLGEASSSKTVNGVTVRSYVSATKGYNVSVTQGGKSAVKKVSGPSEAHVVASEMTAHPDNFL